MGKRKSVKTETGPLDTDKLFSQKGFQNHLNRSEKPTVDIDKIFDHDFKPGDKVKVGPKPKKSSKEKIISSLFSSTRPDNHKSRQYLKF